jgi:HEAT repeat protein
MVCEFLDSGMWADIIDRVIWLPLRELKGREWRDVRQLLCEYYLSGSEDSQLLGTALWTEFERDKTRTLFILDGLDEVSQEVNDRSSALLLDLLIQPRTIITTRPYAINWDRIKNIDVRLETVGFYPDQMEEYIKAVATDKADQIQAFVERHPIVKELARIPIQLDALCYGLEVERVLASDVPETMTQLYKVIELTLWSKDIVPLEKHRPGAAKPITEYEARGLDSDEIKPLVSGEVRMLQGLAFLGLCSDTVVEFHSGHLRQVRSRLSQTASSIDLDKLSFLRTSDGHLTPETRSYHFLHLTFQEFFAAQFFVEHWGSTKPLPFLTGGRNAESFLRTEKYNARYDVLWRFVAGLLHAEPDKTQLSKFLTTVNEPLDLLGPVHQRLIMRCLSEVAGSEDDQELTKLRTDLESQLKEWLLFECQTTNRSHLVGEIEFPESILAAVLQEEPDDIKTIIMDWIGARPNVPSAIIASVPAWLTGNISRIWKRAILDMIGTQPALPEAVLKAIFTQLGDLDPDVRISAAIALGQQPALPEAILKALATQLGDLDPDVRISAAIALGWQPALPEATLKALATLLGDSDPAVRSSAASALGWQPALPEAMLELLAARLEKDSDPEVRSSAASALGRQAALPEAMLKALAARLEEDLDASVRSSTAEVLGRQPALPEAMLELLAARLGKDSDPEVRSSAASALGRQTALPEAMLKALAARLEDSIAIVRRSAASALGRQPALPEAILKALATLLEDSKPFVQKSAAYALGRQPALPEPVLNAMATQLKGSDANVRSTAAFILGQQPNISDEDFSVFLLALDDISFQNLFYTWLERSFWEHTSWYIAGEDSYIDMPETRKIPLGQLKSSIRKAQEFWKVPNLMITS